MILSLSILLIFTLLLETSNTQLAPPIDPVAEPTTSSPSTQTPINNSTLPSHSTTIPSTIPNPLCDPKCFWSAAYIESANLKTFPKTCATVCTDLLKIDGSANLTEKQLTNAFKNMKQLIGDLLVTRTSYTSGKFLAALETVDCGNTGDFKWSLNPNLTEIALPNLKSVACRIEITSNAKLTKLNLPNMVPTPSPKAQYPRTGILISDNSPDLCISTQEMSNFLSNEANDIGTMPSLYCATSPSNGTVKSCVFENHTLTTMDTGCVKIRGDVLISANDEEHTRKLENVTDILGSLTIDGTNLTSIDFLDNLKNVIALQENQSAILIQYNDQLSNASFPSLKRAIAKPVRSIIFQNNSEELLMDPSVCFGIRNVLNTTNVFIPTIDGQDCETIEKDAVVRDKAGGRMSWLGLTILSVILPVWF